MLSSRVEGKVHSEEKQNFLWASHYREKSQPMMQVGGVEGTSKRTNTNGYSSGTQIRRCSGRGKGAWDEAKGLSCETFCKENITEHDKKNKYQKIWKKAAKYIHKFRKYKNGQVDVLV